MPRRAVALMGAAGKRNTSTGSTPSNIPQVGTTTIFTEGFELGNFSRWNSAQTHTLDTSASSYPATGRYSLQIVNAGADHPHALRTEVRDGDTAVGSHERAELSGFGKVDLANEGDEHWYEFDVRFGDPTWSPSWSSSDDWLIFCQSHHEGDAYDAPPLALSVHSDNRVYFEREADDVIQPFLPIWTVRPGVWEHVVIHVKWSPNPAVGFVEAFVNNAQAVPKTFCQTQHTGDTARQYLKIGTYRRNTVSGTTVVMHDNLRISSPPAGTPSTGTSGDGTSADGTETAKLLGWGSPLSSSDEFGYTGAPDSTKWSVYDSAGHAGNGVRSPSRVTVSGGKMVLTGLAGSANTAGMAHKLTRTYGRYEIRCRSFYTSSPTSTGLAGGYHPVLIIWPADDVWPGNGEYDLLENGEPGEQAAGAFLHYPSLDGDDHQIEVSPHSVDLRQYHNFAFEWSASGLKGWVDGNLWFSYSGGAASDRKNIQDMVGGQLTVQLDAFQSTGLVASTFELEWVRIYASP